MFKVTLLTPKKELYVGLALKVILPTQEGEITVLDFHQPILSRLAAGVVSVDDRWLFRIKDGIAQMSGLELLGMVEI